jgi:hypothetical protein
VTEEEVGFPAGETERVNALRAYLYGTLTRSEAVIGGHTHGLIAEQDGQRFVVHLVIGPTDKEPTVRYGPNGEIL